MKFFLLSVAAAFDHEFVVMLRKNIKQLTPVQIEQIQDIQDLHPEVHKIQDMLYEKQIEAYPEQDGGCDDCMLKFVKWWYDQTFKYFEDWCSKDTKCPVQKRICKLFHDEPKVFAGVLYVWGQPVDAGYFYCCGKGECKMPSGLAKVGSMGTDTMKEAIENLNLGNSASWDQPEEPGTEMELYQTQEEIEEIILQGDFKLFGEEFDTDDFKQCVKKTSCWIMKHVMKNIVDWCKKTKDPKAKKECDWWLAHKKFTFGAALAYTQPWKYAEGYCCPDRPKNPFKKLAGFMQQLNGWTHAIQEKEKEFQS